MPTHFAPPSPLIAPHVPSHVPATPKPLYAQVRDGLLERVKAGEWAAGESLPNEFILSGAYSVSIGTIRRAVAELEMSGVLLRKQGRGTYVSGSGPMALQQKFSTLRSLDGLRLDVAWELSTIAQRPAEQDEAARLAIEPASRITEVVQHTTSADRTVGIERSVLAASRFPRLDTQLRYGQHLYPLLADYGCLITRVVDTVGIGHNPDIAKRLGCAPDAALLVVRRTAYSLDAEPIEQRTSHYNPSKVQWASPGADHQT